MQKKELDSYIKAGKICREVQENAKKNIKKGQKLLDIAEKDILVLGGKPAFPVNLSLNNIAAHYTPSIDDKTILEEDVIKVDIGVHVNGFIADSAMTLDFSGKNKGLVKASEKALENALKMSWGDKPRRQAEKFSWDKIAKQYEDLFKQLVSVN